MRQWIDLFEATHHIKLAPPAKEGDPARELENALVDGSEPHPHRDRLVYANAVVFDVGARGADTLRLHSIESLEKGKGTEFMKWLCGLADKVGSKVQLDPKPFGDNAMPEKKLISWYEGFGFVLNGERMERQPRTVIKLRGFNRRH